MAVLLLDHCQWEREEVRVVSGCAWEVESCREKTSPALSYEEEMLIRQGRGTCQVAILT